MLQRSMKNEIKDQMLLSDAALLGEVSDSPQANDTPPRG